MSPIETTTERVRRACEFASRAKEAARLASAAVVEAQRDLRDVLERTRATLERPIYPF